mmetsp:Transcript_5704/g.19477  ORF Transcript_5704/g.19477 Transcript_5704/m.19477 type:complete len:201 (+) Transcript_5704:130-732(+)
MSRERVNEARSLPERRRFERIVDRVENLPPLHELCERLRRSFFVRARVRSREGGAPLARALGQRRGLAEREVRLPQKRLRLGHSELRRDPRRGCARRSFGAVVREQPIRKEYQEGAALLFLERDPLLQTRSPRNTQEPHNVVCTLHRHSLAEQSLQAIGIVGDGTSSVRLLQENEEFCEPLQLLLCNRFHGAGHEGLDSS